nr:apolipoprotein N-acyltransferase [Deinococcus geothermalis]
MLRLGWPGAMLSGATLALLLFLPAPLGVLAPLPLAALHRRLARSPNGRAAFRQAFTFALAFFVLHLAWLPLSMAGVLGPLGGLLTVLVLPAAALTWAVPLALTRWVFGARTLLALPFMWVILEVLRAGGPLAFPWGAPGYALVDTPLAQLASLGGVSLLTLLVTVTASVLAALGSRRHPGLVLALLSVWSMALLWSWRGAPQPTRTAVLVQGAIDPRVKAQGRTLEELNIYLDLTRRALSRGPADLVVWPETASPLPASDPRVLGPLRNLGVPVLLGAPGDVPGQARNSAYSVDGRVTGRQDKRVLVPFGESLPFAGTLGFLYTPVLSGLGMPGYISATPGRVLNVLPLRDLRVGVSICYESVFPALSRQAVRAGANLLVVISNDAWFGRGPGAEQHFRMGRLRAIETGRYLLRAGNDGVSAVVDPWGRVVFRAPRGERAAYRAPFGVVSTRTPFVRYGDWVLAGSAVLLLALLSGRFSGGKKPEARGPLLTVGEHALGRADDAEDRYGRLEAWSGHLEKPRRVWRGLRGDG